MTEETENLMLGQLREIRAKLDGLDRLETRLAATDVRVDKIDRGLDSFRALMSDTVGLAGAASRRAKQAEAKAAQALDWQDNFDGEMERLEKKLPKN